MESEKDLIWVSQKTYEIVIEFRILLAHFS